MAFGFPKERFSYEREPKQKLLGVPKPPRYQFTTSAHCLMNPVSKVSINEKEKEIQSVPLNGRTCMSREGRNWQQYEASRAHLSLSLDFIHRSLEEYIH